MQQRMPRETATIEGRRVLTRMNLQKSEAVGAVGVAVVAIAMLLWAALGSPPYAFYGVMKWVVAGSCCYSAWGCWKLNRALAPVSVILLSVAAIHLLGKMRKAEWPLFNWVGVAGLVLVVAIMTVALKRGATVDPA